MNKSEIDNSPNDRNALEAQYVSYRILELRLDPVQGNFDAAHLREINRRIFQDLPGAGFTDVTPGQYRPPTPEGYDWIKNRTLESVGISSYVAYSPMDEAARARLDNVLKDINPAEFAKLKTAEFTQKMGALYTELDYIHPFSDGNSRTLREFTRQLAEQSGYELDWDRFNRSPAGRDILYIARDKSVNELAMPQIQHDDTKRNIVFSTDQLEGNRYLPELLKDAIRPGRAVTFDLLPRYEAIKEHPDRAEQVERSTITGTITGKQLQERIRDEIKNLSSRIDTPEKVEKLLDAEKSSLASKPESLKNRNIVQWLEARINELQGAGNKLKGLEQSDFIANDTNVNSFIKSRSFREQVERAISKDKGLDR